MTTDKQIEVWQQEAIELYQPIHRLLSGWQPKVLLKHGRFSPWCIPRAWGAATGAFNFFFRIYVAEQTLFCAPQYRRAILAHELGHARSFHTPLLMTITSLFIYFSSFPLLTDAIGAITQATNAWIGLTVWVELGLLLFMVTRWFFDWVEYEADDYAAHKVGAQTIVETLEWLRGPPVARKKHLSQLDKRIERLRNLQTLQKG